MTISGVFWLIIAFLVAFLLLFVWKKGKVKADKQKGILYLGLIFTAVGLFEWCRYGEWYFLAMGLLFLLASWLKQKRAKKGKKS